MQVAQWNYTRDNTNFDMELELNMLAEEAQEFKDGLNDLFGSSTREDELDAVVEMVDAYCDYKFVARGTQYKALGRTIDLGLLESTLSYMKSLLLDLVAEDVLDTSYKLVCDANDNKTSQKVNGKVQKGLYWKDPKESIRELLQC